MDTINFPLYSILFIISIIGGVAGIIFLMIGLINDKKKMWIPGAIATGLAIIIACVAVFLSVSAVFKFAGKKVTESIDLVDEAIMDEFEEGYNMDDYNYFLDKGFSYPESEYFYICDNYRQTFLYLQKDLESIQIIEYAKASSAEDGLAIRINIKVKQKVNKTFKLKVYDTAQGELGETNFKVNGLPNTNLWSNIDLSDIEDICEAKYFTIENMN